MITWMVESINHRTADMTSGSTCWALIDYAQQDKHPLSIGKSRRGMVLYVSSFYFGCQDLKVSCILHCRDEFVNRKEHDLDTHCDKLECTNMYSREEKKKILSQAITEQKEYLLKSIKAQVYQFGLECVGDSAMSLAEDILQDTVEKALTKAEQYNPTYEPLPWLRKIALNEIRQLYRRQQTERKQISLVRDNSAVKHLAKRGETDSMSDDDIFDLLYHPPDTSSIKLDELLSLVSESDKEILELAFIYGYQGKALGEKLGISEAAAWKRQSRAIRRLREKYNRNEALGERGKI